MLEKSEIKILSILTESERVLDVGGWACPFNRANWIMDSEPYETRGFYRTFGGLSFQGGVSEYFSKETWIQRDICDKKPYPFSDKYFDFVVCSHTLEDIRDPLWVCSELIRIGKRGYIEVPSREHESSRGVERPGMAGLSHHRWLVEINHDMIRFIPKFGALHSHWKYSFPSRFGRSLGKEGSVQSLWWTETFRFEEVQIHGLEAIEKLLQEYVQSVRPYPKMAIIADRFVASSYARVVSKLMRLFGRP